MSMRERSAIRWAMDKAKDLVREVAGTVEGNEEAKAEGCLERRSLALRVVPDSTLCFC